MPHEQSDLIATIAVCCAVAFSLAVGLIFIIIQVTGGADAR